MIPEALKVIVTPRPWSESRRFLLHPHFCFHLTNSVHHRSIRYTGPARLPGLFAAAAARCHRLGPYCSPEPSESPGRVLRDTMGGAPMGGMRMRTQQTLLANTKIRLKAAPAPAKDEFRTRVALTSLPLFCETISIWGN